MPSRNLLGLGRAAWRGLAPHALRETVAPLLNTSLHKIRLPPAQIRAAHQPIVGPLVVSGFFDEAMGIARAGNLTANGFEAAGFTVVRHAIRPLIIEPAFHVAELPGNGGVWLSHCNAPEAALMMARLRNRSWLSRYRIGYWAWELPEAPAPWLRAARYFHEIWTPSQYVADSLAKAPVTVRIMPHPVVLDAGPAPETGRFARLDGRVRVLALADLRSSLSRKNPIAAIEAYKLAFPTTRPGCELVVKLNSVASDPAAYAQVRAAAEERTDIVLMTEVLGAAEMDALMSSSDIVLSLHRAEGFGLTLAEAMARGSVVLATGWSGNLEFMSNLPELLVPFSMTPISDPSGVYVSSRQRWAEPDLSAAGTALRRMVDDPALRRRLGAACREAIEETHASWRTEALLAQPFAAYVEHASRPSA